MFWTRPSFVCVYSLEQGSASANRPSLGELITELSTNTSQHYIALCWWPCRQSGLRLVRPSFFHNATCALYQGWNICPLSTLLCIHSSLIHSGILRTAICSPNWSPPLFMATSVSICVGFKRITSDIQWLCYTCQGRIFFLSEYEQIYYNLAGVRKCRNYLNMCNDCIAH